MLGPLSALLPARENLPSRETVAKCVFYGTATAIAGYAVIQSGMLTAAFSGAMDSATPSPSPTFSATPTLTPTSTPTPPPTPTPTPFNPLGATGPQTYEDTYYSWPCPDRDPTPFEVLYNIVDVTGRQICFNATALATKALRAMQHEPVTITGRHVVASVLEYGKGVAAGMRLMPPHAGG
ncbi:MAG: hypothetical protein SP1CHLAM54_12970 [Chlamydiia bacterium]|nr:hypothetical protein [Chlamydiia bacterium]MCH9616193.1 hypothetical protein [Chlamydiia bacterium]MCH9629821.1 hypothetical protein [Chlamydiia bacterium]